MQYLVYWGVGILFENNKKEGEMTAIYKLVDEVTGAEINAGDKRKCHNYDGLVTVTGWETNGRNRVYFAYEDGYNVKIEGGMYAGVVGAKLVREVV